MKKNITILVALFVTFSAFAQNYEQMLSDHIERLNDQNDDVLMSSVALGAVTIYLNDSTIWYEFDSPTDSTPYSRYDNKFDDAGNRIEGIYSKWDDVDNKWVGDEKETYVYEGGQYVAYITAPYDENIGDFVNDYKKAYTNDDNGLPKVAHYYYWKNDAWESTPYRKKEYLHDYNGFLIEETYYLATGVDEYDLEKQYMSSYNVDGNITAMTYNKWDSDLNGGSGDWYNYKAYSWEYDSNGFLTTYLYNKYNSDISDYYFYKKETYENDANGYLLTHTYLKFDNDISVNDYVLTDKVEYTVDENGNKKIAVEYEYEDESWLLVQKGFYIFRSFVPSSINSKTAVDFSFNMYPNPAKEFVQIELNNSELATVSIYTILGKQIIEQRINRINNTIVLDDFTAGIYILQIDNGTSNKSKRLVIK